MSNTLLYIIHYLQIFTLMIYTYNLLSNLQLEFTVC